MLNKIYRCAFIPRGDYEGPGYCTATFPTSSARSVHAEQLIAAGWIIVVGYPDKPERVDSLHQLDRWGQIRPGQRERVVLCPQHPPGVHSRMSQSWKLRT